MEIVTHKKSTRTGAFIFVRLVSYCYYGVHDAHDGYDGCDAHDGCGCYDVHDDYVFDALPESFCV